MLGDRYYSLLVVVIACAFQKAKVDFNANADLVVVVYEDFDAHVLAVNEAHNGLSYLALNTVVLAPVHRVTYGLARPIRRVRHQQKQCAPLRPLNVSKPSSSLVVKLTSRGHRHSLSSGAYAVSSVARQFSGLAMAFSLVAVVRLTSLLSRVTMYCKSVLPSTPNAQRLSPYEEDLGP